MFVSAAESETDKLTDRQRRSPSTSQLVVVAAVVLCSKCLQCIRVCTFQIFSPNLSSNCNRLVVVVAAAAAVAVASCHKEAEKARRPHLFYYFCCC